MVGRAPIGIAVSGGSVWVANSGGRNVSRINVATGRVVQEIEVGNAPRASVAVGDGLWVANATDSTLVRIDAASGTIGEPVGVGANPVALYSVTGGVETCKRILNSNTVIRIAANDVASTSH